MSETLRPAAAIEEVTVYRDGARLVRSLAVALTAGLQTVTLLEAPATTDPASVRLVSRSPGAGVVDVEVELRHRTQSSAQKTRELEERVEGCRLALQEIHDEDAGEEARLGYLSHLSSSTATSLARAVALGRLGRDELAAMEAHLGASTTAALARRRHIQVRANNAERELHAAEAALRDLTQRNLGVTAPVEFCELRATVEAADAGEATFEVTYHVHQASWRPLYDIRLEGDHLRVTYLAEVTQRSGEDWPETSVILSTTRRGAHQQLPELRPWYVGLRRPDRIPIGARPTGKAVNRTAGAAFPEPPPMPDGLPYPTDTPPFFDEPTAAAVPTPAAMQTALSADVRESGTAMTYRVPRTVAVPSDGVAHKVPVAELELEAQLDYLAVPALAAEAYLRATVTNTSSLVLLPGAAQVFYDGEYIGRTVLETVAPGEEFELQLGVDDRIRIERQLSRRKAGKAVLGGTRKLDVGYEITVANHRGLPARITLRDHIPLSRDGEVKVRLGDVDPKTDEVDELGELVWNLSLQAGAETKVRYAFTVEHPGRSALEGI